LITPETTPPSNSNHLPDGTYADGGTTTIGTGAVGSDGTFDITASPAFADGQHILTATETDAVGLISAQSVGFSITVDRDPGEQAGLKLTVGTTIIGPTAASAVPFTIAGLDPEDTGTVTFLDSSGNVVQVTVNGGQTSYTANLTTLTDGAITSSLAVNIDPAGNSFTVVSGPTVVLEQNQASRVFFDAVSQTASGVLWTTQGIPNDAQLVPNAPASSDLMMAAVGTQLLFFGYNGSTNNWQLWKTDGITTVMVTNVNPGGRGLFPGGNNPGSNIGLLASQDISVGGTLFFTADDGTYGEQLWKSDGSAAGTTMVSDINPGIGAWGIGPVLIYPYLTNVSGAVFFAANDGIHGTQLWKFDGTGAGTTMLTSYTSPA
jgi:ELWxxDGT repeat protein